MSSNKATTNSLAKQMRIDIANGYVLPDNFNWNNPCSQCDGKGNAKSSCCSEYKCGGCDGYGVENLGPKDIDVAE